MKNILLSGILFISSLIINCADTVTQVDQSKNEIPKASASTPSKPNLELLDSNFQAEEIVPGYPGTTIRYVVGTIRNNTNKQYSYISVSINLYDSSGAQIGSTLDNVNNVEPGGIWKFKAIVTEDKASNYKVKEIKGH